MGKGEVTRQVILDKATRLSSRVGLGGLTIGSLAAETQLSKSGLFAHFRSKESLQVAVVENAIAQFLDQVVRPALAAPRGERRLRELFERWLGWADGSPGGCLFVAAMTEFDDRQGPVRDVLERYQRDWLEGIGLMFQTGITEGEFRDDADPAQFAQDFYGILLGYHYVSRLLRSPGAQARARRALEMLLAAARIQAAQPA
jgi:AcrR family transcriptional regulator